MRKKFLTTAMAAVMAVIMAATMTGCGKDDSTSAKSDKTSTKKESKTEKSTEQDEALTLSGIISGSDYSIWYRTKDVDKDSSPDIYVLYNDGTYISASSWGINSSAPTFKELSEMSDEEIVSYVENEWKEARESEAASQNEKNVSDVQSKYYEYYSYLSTGNMDDFNNRIREKYVDILVMVLENYVMDVDVEAGTIDADFDEINLGFDDFMEDWLKEHPEDEVEFVINTEYGGGSLPDFTELCEAYFNYQKEGYEADIANAETATASYEKSTYTINAYTDASGNNIKDEEIVFDNNNSWGIEYGVYPKPVLDAFYGGYSEGDRLYLIRTTQDALFELDDKDTEGLIVD